MKRRSILRPRRLTGLEIYFWTSLGPVYMLRISTLRLSETSMSMERAMFGGLLIQRLSFYWLLADR